MNKKLYINAEYFNNILYFHTYAQINKKLYFKNFIKYMDVSKINMQIILYIV